MEISLHLLDLDFVSAFYYGTVNTRFLIYSLKVTYATQIKTRVKVVASLRKIICINLKKYLKQHPIRIG